MLRLVHSGSQPKQRAAAVQVSRGQPWVDEEIVSQFTRPVTSPAANLPMAWFSMPSEAGILARVKNSIKVEAGHQYLIVASAEDGEIFTS